MRRYRLSEIAKMMGFNETIKNPRHRNRAAKRELQNWEERDGKRYLVQDKPGSPWKVDKRAIDALFRMREGAQPASIHGVANRQRRDGKRIDELEAWIDANTSAVADMRRLLPDLIAFLASRVRR